MKNFKNDKKAQELSASWSMEWFIENILLVILFFLILSFGLYFMIRWLTSY